MSFRNRSFVLLCAATFAFFLCFAMFLPTLPKEVKGLGGSGAAVGLVVGAASISALALRPWTGRLTDVLGRRIFLVLGCADTLVVSLALRQVKVIPAFVGIRLVQGFALAAFYPAATSLVGDMAPPERRGEVLGWFSIFLNLGVALGPFVGERLLAWRGFGTVCATAATVSGIGMVAALCIHDDRPEHPPATGGPLVSREAIFPGVVNGLAGMAYAACSSFVPLWALSLGRRDSSLFFIVFAGTIVLVRPMTGRMSDRRGRRLTIVPGLFLCGAAMLELAVFASWGGIVAAGFTFGLAWGLLIPGLTAFTLDRAPEGRRGSAMGTFTAFVDLGIGGGAWVIGAVVDGLGYRSTFALVSVPAFLGCALFIWGTRPRAPDPAPPAGDANVTGK